MAEAPRILLEHHLKRLKLPTFLREYEKLARQCAAEGLDHVQFLARLVELELIDREAPPRRAAYQAGPLPRRQTARELRLQGDPGAQQDAGAGSRARRLHRPPGECDPARPERRREDACRSRPRPRRLPEGPRRALHHRLPSGPRA